MSSKPDVTLGHEDALILVDVQHDFCPGGKLAVDEGHEVVDVLNAWIERAREGGAVIVASRDWHPEGHVSFEAQGGEWPEHCVQGTEGAELHSELALPDDAILVSKGNVRERDNYSAFEGTGLAPVLGERGVRRVWIGGLAQDVCVKATALDSVKHGFRTSVILDATRPVTSEGGREAIRAMREAGVAIVGEGDG